MRACKMCVHTSKSRIGNWSVEVGGSALSGPGSSGLHVQATLDHREKVWLNGTLEGRCFHTTAGYMNGNPSLPTHTTHTHMQHTWGFSSPFTQMPPSSLVTNHHNILLYNYTIYQVTAFPYLLLLFSSITLYNIMCSMRLI